ncbi:MAG: urease accessory protein [Bacteroidota bacterium]
MEATLPLLFAAVVGFGHAFEVDHLVAVGNIVTKRDRMILAMKDGIYWGLGHSSTIVLIGLIMIIGKATFLNDCFGYFEAAVGAMLVLLGIVRLYQFFHPHQKASDLVDAQSNHHLAYGVGLVHGLAGSGAMILLVMTEIQSSWSSMLYLLIFGIGSIAGMLVAAGIFSLPFSKKLVNNQRAQLALVLLSSVLCIAYGGYVMFENLS